MNKKGVTLIELVIVMVIIAIGAVLAAPNIGGFLPRYRLRSATRDIVSTMRTAQIKAVSTNREYQVSLDGTTESYILQYKNTMGDWVDEGVTQTLPKGIEIVGDAGFNAEFNPNSTSSSGSVTLKNPKNSTRKIVLHYTGRIRVE
jgi:prepilin-type N-terminal cleavage/methylation domain-containing protein